MPPTLENPPVASRYTRKRIIVVVVIACVCVLACLFGGFVAYRFFTAPRLQETADGHYKEMDIPTSTIQDMQRVEQQIRVTVAPKDADIVQKTAAVIQRSVADRKRVQPLTSPDITAKEAQVPKNVPSSLVSTPAPF